MASRLFDEAKKDLEKGHVADACPKLAESERLDPELGTLLHLGECYAKLGKTASAWASFRDAAEIAGKRGDAREPRIRSRLSAIEKTLSNIIIDVSAPGADGLEIRQDGSVIGSAAWGTPIPVDPGTHSITASAPGMQDWKQTVEVGAGASAIHVAVPQLTPSEPSPSKPESDAAPEPPRMPAADTTTAPVMDDHRAAPGGTQRVLGWTAVGVGAVGLGLGIGFQLQRSAKLSDRDAVCPTRMNCTEDEAARIASLTSEARTASTISVVGFAAGGVLAAGGLVLVLLAPHGGSPHRVALSPVAAPGFAGVTVVGRMW